LAKVLDVVLVTSKHFPRASNLQKGITLLEVNGNTIVGVDAPQVYSVFEVPTEQDIDPSHAGPS
jgi:hypothetical protein